MQNEMKVSLDCESTLPSEKAFIKDGDSDVTFSSLNVVTPQQPVKKPTRQWAAWTRQEEESFFNALRQVGKNFEKITSCVQSKNKDQVRHYYYRLVRRMNKLLGPGFSLDAKNSKDTIAAMLRWWSLLEKYSCKASKLHLKPRRFKIFIEALEHQLLKDRRKNIRKRPSQGDNCLSAPLTTVPNNSKEPVHDAHSVKLVVVDSQNIQKVGSGKGSSLKCNANIGITRSSKGDMSAVKTAKQRRKSGSVSSAAYKRWEKAALAGVSLVADAAEHLECALIDKSDNSDHGVLNESFSRPVGLNNGQKGINSAGKILSPLPTSSEHQDMENSTQFSIKLKLQLFPIDEETRRALEEDDHNPHLELTLSARKKISSVLEHLNRKWGSSSIASGELMLFPYSVQRENFVVYQRWTQDTIASAADVYAIIGSPPIFRLRYGWFSNTELGSANFQAISTFHVREEHTSVDILNGKEQIVDAIPKPAPPTGPGNSILVSSEHATNSSWLSKENGAGRQWDDVDNQRLSNSTILSAGEWADSLTNISIGDLLSEAPHNVDNTCTDLPTVGSSECVHPISFSCDSFDAAIAAHISSHQDKMRQQSAQVSLATSIWDAEQTCDAFSFQKIKALNQELPDSIGITSLGLSKGTANTNCMDFQGLDKEPPEAFDTDDPARERDIIDNCQSDTNKPDESAKNISELMDIYWPDSLGPLDLDVPSSRYHSEDLILGDSLSGLNRLIASSLDAFQNCSFFGLGKKEPVPTVETRGTVPLSDYKVGS